MYHFSNVKQSASGKCGKGEYLILKKDIREYIIQ
jgi:hypothetical protein